MVLKTDGLVGHWKLDEAAGTTAADSSGTAFELDAVPGKTPALVRIDSSHHLCAYEGAASDGWSVVLIPDPNAITILP